MNSLILSRCALGVCAAATLLAGCGGLQPVGVTQGPAPQGQMPENAASVSGVRQSPRSVRHVTETVLHSFRGYPYDGSFPRSGLTYFKGTFYGATDIGGSYGCRDDGIGIGCGTVYSITPSGTETVLYRFKGGEDGALPDARMIVLKGTLYGTTSLRGGGKCPNDQGGGCGTVFSITPSGHETVLYGFAGSPDGSNPAARLLNVNGTFFGTTQIGGSACPSRGGCGTVFSITPGGQEKVLYSFRGGTDGGIPAAGLIDVKGTLYGTTSAFGPYNGGTVFSISPGGKEKVLYSFGASYAGGNDPSGLVEVGGTLYGTNQQGGVVGSCYTGGGCGTVFSITPSGKEKVLYTFSGPDGAYPLATLLNVNGTLYGTTFFGGAYNDGTVFSITRSGHETVLYSFGGSAQDGKLPQSGLNYVNGTFYGTTAGGGAYGGMSGTGGGTVYSIKL